MCQDVVYHFDTNILVLLLRGKDLALAVRIAALGRRQRCVSAVVRAELLLGIEKSDRRAQRAEQLEQFLCEFETVDFDSSCAAHYASIRGHLERTGCRIGDNDTMIAATARAYGAVLITRNEGEFKRVPGLTVEPW